MSSGEVETWDELPGSLQLHLVGKDLFETGVLAYNAGVRAGQSAGGDVRMIIAAMLTVVRDGIPFDQREHDWANRYADALIAALAKETP